MQFFFKDDDVSRQWKSRYLMSVEGPMKTNCVSVTIIELYLQTPARQK